MGTVHSIDSCSGAEESHKDSLWTALSEKDLYDLNHQQVLVACNAEYHQTLPLPRPVPDANGSVERKLGAHNATAATTTTTTGAQKRDHHHPHNNNDDDDPNHSHHHFFLAGGLTKRLPHVKRPSLRRVRQASSSMIRGSKRLLFPHGSPTNRLGHSLRRHHHHHHSQQQDHGKKTATPTPNIVATKVRGGVLMQGCYSDEEHKQLARKTVELLRALHGQEALTACGFEYRTVCLDDQANDDDDEKEDLLLPRKPTADGLLDKTNVPKGSLSGLMEERGVDDDATPCSCPAPKMEKEESTPRAGGDKSGQCTCECKQPSKTMTRLFHIDSGTMITMKNRKLFIADGDMYDAIARVAMEYAQEVMVRDGMLEWLTVEEPGNNPEPIRALVSKRLLEDETRLDNEPTLLIATGKGKVRAGIFSRQHLLLTGLEISSAIPIIREARKRKMNIIMIDPNAHGDRLGMTTFEKSMARIFRRWEQQDNDIPSKTHRPESACPCKRPLDQRDLYVLSHSQSGAQFARYLLEKSEHYLPHIRAVCFTDSTHNIQWTKDKEDLRELLESDISVYFKCAQESDGPLLSPLPSLGEQVETDHFWRHRFGAIKTLCAGTAEHSLTNWFARCEMWKHFDQYLPRPVSSSLHTSALTRTTTTTTELSPTSIFDFSFLPRRFFDVP